MSRTRRKKSFVAGLVPEEHVLVLLELLTRHPDLCDEADAIAKDLLDEVSVEDVASEVVWSVGSVGMEALGSRAGKQPWGYVEPSQAALDLLEESVQPFRDDMNRRYAAGIKAAAERICVGIVLGLYRIRDVNDDGVLLYVPDFPSEGAAYTVSCLIKLYPMNHRLAVGRRLVSGAMECDEEWGEMLSQVVERAAEAKFRRRK